MLREIFRPTLAALVHQLHTVKVGHRITDSGFAEWICGNGVGMASLRCGAKALVPYNDYVGRAMYLWGDTDPRITAMISAVLEPGDEMLDIGANFGVTGLTAAARVGERGRVHLFEPQAFVAQLLRTSLLINGYAQATVHEVALSDRAETVAMEFEPGNLGTAHIVHSEQPNGSTPRVRAEHAGEYVRKLDCRRVPLIKLDVEGHEAIILRALSDLIVELHVGVVLFECHLGDQPFWQQESVQCLAELGFRFFAFDMKPLWATRLIPVHRDQAMPVGHDFAAIRAEELTNGARQRLQHMARPFELA